MVELPATVGLGVCSAAILDVSLDSLFTALELSALKTWLVRLANVSDCTVNVCGSHVKRVSIRSNCTDLDAAFFLDFFFWARRDGEGKSCRPPLSISHVLPLTLRLTFPCLNVSTWKKRVHHSFRENSVSSSSHVRESAGKPLAVLSHKRKSSQETVSDREGISSGREPLFSGSLIWKKLREQFLKNKEIIYFKQQNLKS